MIFLQICAVCLKMLHRRPGKEYMDEEQSVKNSGKAVGKVWLVGAGPGDAGLLTVKAREVIREADVIVYDALVGGSILSLLPPSARLIDAGKRSGSHTIPQRRMNELLLEEAQAGHKVVRLKGGDPFVFGRGGEELELLAQHGIPFEVVPGVTSAFAVPAYNGIPVTHRDFTSSVHVITGHKRKGAEYDIDFEALVRTKGTLIFLMGVATLPELMQGLMDAGMDPATPAAILEEGTTARQRRVVSTVVKIAEDAKRAYVKPPAITVVGGVAGLSDQFAWYEKLPLSGTRILLTRPRGLSSQMAHLLREKGAEVLELPAIETVPREEAEEAIGHAAEYDWLVFTSPTGVQIFMDMYLRNHDIRSLGSVKIAVIGEGSRKMLKSYGILADFMPSVYDGETLGRELAPLLKEGEHVLIPRASIGNRELIRELSAVPNLVISDVPTYDTVYRAPAAVDERKELEEGRVDYVVFTSASTVKGFREAVGDMDFSSVNAVCIGRQTKAAADALGMKTFVSEKATMCSLAAKVEELVREEKAGS